MTENNKMDNGCNHVCIADNSDKASLLVDSQSNSSSWRDRDTIAFCLFGLTNNLPYVVMISAANDILSKNDPGLGTGIILLADVIPGLLLNLSFPFILQKIGSRVSFKYRIALVVCSSILSFIMVALSNFTWLSLMGVAFASFSCGLGELTFLTLTSFYDKNTITAWSSGTGMLIVI